MRKRETSSDFSIPFDRGYFGQGGFSLEKNSFITVELDLRDNQKVLYFYAAEELFKTIEIQNEATQFKFCVCLISFHFIHASHPPIPSQIAGARASSLHSHPSDDNAKVEVVSVEETSSISLVLLLQNWQSKFKVAVPVTSEPEHPPHQRQRYESINLSDVCMSEWPCRHCLVTLEEARARHQSRLSWWDDCIGYDH